jgi:hypothetical protein
MLAPTHAPVPPGQAAPFLVASSTDHSPDIVLVAVIGIALILLTFVIRIYIRFTFSGPWLVDDTVFAFATVRNPLSELPGVELVIRQSRLLRWHNHQLCVRRSTMDGEETSRVLIRPTCLLQRRYVDSTAYSQIS